VEIVCQGCGAKLSVPDDKLPAVGVAQATCPKCGAKVLIPARESRPAAGEPSAYAPNLLERFEEGAQFALVLHEDDDTARAIGEALVELGYRISRGANPDEAAARIKLNSYDVVVLQDGFGAGADEQQQAPVLNFLNGLPMSQRRQMFVALVGPGLSTADRMEAFLRSVNLTISEGDISSLGKILKNSVAEHEVFYKVFNETLKGLGRG